VAPQRDFVSLAQSARYPTFGSVLLLGMGKLAQISLVAFGEAAEFRGVDVLLGISCSRPLRRSGAMVELLEIK